jgi:hypothetical protein
MNPTDAQIEEANLRNLVMRDGWAPVMAEIARLRARAEAAEKQVSDQSNEIQRLHGVIDGMAMLASGYSPVHEHRA